MIGRKFGFLTVVGRDETKSSYWCCRCDCGKTKSVSHSNLVGNKVGCCGWSCESKYSMKGKTFGRVQVIDLDHMGDGTSYWKCRCECGNEVVIRRGHLEKKRKFLSCGCSRRGKNSSQWKGFGDLTGSYFKKIQNMAQRRRRRFEVGGDYLWDLFCVQQGKCAISGDSIFLPRDNYELYHGKSSASLDRIDSAKGYLVDNVQWVHKTINMMKQQLPQQEFVDFCSRIVDFTDGVLAKEEVVTWERGTKDGRPGGFDHGLWRGVGELSKTAYSSIVNSAIIREIVFELDMNYLWELFLEQGRVCKLSGLALVLPNPRTEFGTASLDRIDSSKGYIAGNVQWLHKKINFMKQRLTQACFIETCRKIVEYQSLIEAAGGNCQSSVGKTTNYLVRESGTGGGPSEKEQKAQKLGVPVIGPDALEKMLSRSAT